MNCKRTRKMIGDYVNEVLGSEDSCLVEEHIAECDSCRQELETTRKILTALDSIKVEYPPASIWENFLPDLHRRIEQEAAIIFKNQSRQRLYFLPGWAAFAATFLLILFSSGIFRSSPPVVLTQPQTLQDTQMAAENSSPAVIAESSPAATAVEPSPAIAVELSPEVITEDRTEYVTVAGIIFKTLITEAEAAELRKLGNFTPTEALMSPYYHEDDVLTYMDVETSSSENAEDVIQYLLESEFVDFDESSIIESEGIEFGAM